MQAKACSFCFGRAEGLLLGCSEDAGAGLAQAAEAGCCSAAAVSSSFVEAFAAEFCIRGNFAIHPVALGPTPLSSQGWVFQGWFFPRTARASASACWNPLFMQCRAWDWCCQPVGFRACRVRVVNPTSLFQVLIVSREGCDGMCLHLGSGACLVRPRREALQWCAWRSACAEETREFRRCAEWCWRVWNALGGPTLGCRLRAVVCCGLFVCSVLCCAVLCVHCLDVAPGSVACSLFGSGLQVSRRISLPTSTHDVPTDSHPLVGQFGCQGRGVVCVHED